MAALTGRRTFIANGRKTTFAPTGSMQFRGRGARRYLENPKLWAGPPAQASRLFVGLNVGDDPVWDIRDVIEIVGAERMQQSGDPSASFVAQKGIFKHAGGGVVEEDSVQVIIFNLDDSITPEQFTGQMVDLASRLAHTLQQELVIVEMQLGGRAVETIGVGP